MNCNDVERLQGMIVDYGIEEVIAIVRDLDADLDTMRENNIV